MGYSQENGYTPVDIDTIMSELMANINTQFGLDPAYTMETFIGTSAYKYFYALAQRAQGNEIKTSEIFEKLQVYFDVINARISRPVVTNPGIIEKFDEEGYLASVKPMTLADAGKISVCVNVDDGDHAVASVEITDYAKLVSGTDDAVTVNGTAFTAQTGVATPGAGTFQAATSNALTAASLALQINSHAVVGLIIRATAINNLVRLRAIHGGTAGNAYTLGYTDNDTNVGAVKSGTTFTEGTEPVDDYDLVKTAICELLSEITVGGAITQGNESEAVVLSNGQSFDFKYYLPNKLEVLLKLTITLSENNEVEVGNPDDTKLALLANLQERYALGKNFEPQRYFSIVDAPWASQVVLEYSLDDGDNWETEIYNAEFDDLFNIELENIEIIED